MFAVRRTEYCDALVLLFCLGCTIVPARASGQAKGFLPIGAMNAKLDTLEQRSLSSDSCNRRTSAVTGIAFAGRAMKGADAPSPPPPYPGIVARLARIYRQTSECDLRGSIIDLMIIQAEREEAVVFLARVAEEPFQPTPPGVVLGTWPTQVLAIGALTHMGQPGEAMLRRLHAEGTVREPTARASLEDLARRGFPTEGN